MQTILITGGAGYIGSHTAVALKEEGYQAVILDNFSNSEKTVLAGLKKILGEELPCYQGDASDKNFVQSVFEKERIDGVIHFAASKAVGESTQIPLHYYRNNLASLWVLLEVMQQYKVDKLVFSSSCTVYGQPDHLPVTESSPRKDAESPYGNTKRVSEDIILDFIKSKAPLSAVSLRYFNPIGAHPTGFIGELPIGVPNSLVPFVTQAAAGIRETITVFGDDYNTKDGTCVRDYIHVMDLAEAHVRCLHFLDKQTSPFYDVLNVGTGNGNTVLEILKTFEKVNRLKLNYKMGPRRPGDVEQVWANTDKIQEKLQWTSRFSLEDALVDAWNWQQMIAK